MEPNEIVWQLRELLPPKVDYAKLVCAEGFAHGQHFVWDGPEPYTMEAAADCIERLQAELEASKRRERAAVFDLSGHCEYCAFRNDCAKHDNNDSSAGFTWWTDCEDWQWRGPEQEGDANHEHDT